MRKIMNLGAVFFITASMYADDVDASASQKKFPFVSVAGMNTGNRPDNGSGFSVALDALLWRATEGGLEYAQNEPTTPTYPYVIGAAELFKPRFTWGGRLNLGYDSSTLDWNFNLIWTYFYSKFHGSTTAAAAGTLVQTFNDPNADNSVTTVDSASGNTRLKFNFIDFLMNRPFLITHYFALKPMVGIRNLWVHQAADVSYVGGSAGTSALTTTFKNNFWGLGAIAGLESQWLFGHGLIFYGNSALSLLAGTMKLSSEEVQSSTTLYSLTDTYEVTKHVTDVGFGLRWNHSFVDKMYNIGVQLGWEQHFFDNFWQWSKASDIRPNGDLSTYGWNFSVNFNF